MEIYNTYDALWLNGTQKIESKKQESKGFRLVTRLPKLSNGKIMTGKHVGDYVYWECGFVERFLPQNIKGYYD